MINVGFKIKNIKAELTLPRPSLVRANAWRPPECTATFRIKNWDSAVICRGEFMLLECPKPKRPLLPSPHA